jgi:transcriptional regulator with XRE-family HTH domain
MADTLGTTELSNRDIYYYQQRNKNRVFEKLVAFFAAEAERLGITKKEIAQRLHRDPAQITRWLSAPNNLTLDSISDLLLALEAEMDYDVTRFSERATPNYSHPLMPHPNQNIQIQHGANVSGTTAITSSFAVLASGVAGAGISTGALNGPFNTGVLGVGNFTVTITVTTSGSAITGSGMDTFLTGTSETGSAVDNVVRVTSR